MEDRVAQNRAEQARLYGAPLHEVIDRLVGGYHINRSRLAALLGISSPMLSQLSSAQRIKVGNPVAVQRLQALMEALPQVHAGLQRPADVMSRIEAEADGHVLTRSTATQRRQGAADVQSVLRAVASASELEAAAALLEPRFPDLAEVLRIYGTARTEDAVRHFERVSSGHP